MSQSPHLIDVDFLELGEHARPNRLREILQQKIDETSSGKIVYDAIILGYCLCGRATDGLIAGREKIIIPRAHDCSTVLLGSRSEFAKHFADMPSTPFSCCGFVDRGEYVFDGNLVTTGDNGYEQLIEQYGQDDAKYIWDAMHPKLDGELMPIYFIRIPEIPHRDAEARCRIRASEDGREFKTLEGNMRLVRQLVNGEWDEEEFLTVNPGESVRMIGDHDRIFRAEKP